MFSSTCILIFLKIYKILLKTLERTVYNLCKEIRNNQNCFYIFKIVVRVFKKKLLFNYLRKLETIRTLSKC